ncbi:hypothetical protein ACHAPT_012712 [Fusarium lateritium]
MGDGVVLEEKEHYVSDSFGGFYNIETPHVTNQSCVYRTDKASEDQRTPVYVCDWKLPHPLTVAHLRVGLRAMDVYKEVTNRETMLPRPDPATRFRCDAERLTACALTDAYNEMVENGLEYGLVTTGEATVFLMIDWGEPGTLYYHLAELGPEVSAHPLNSPMCTAVGQHLAFSLMALGSAGQRGQEERKRAITGLKTWRRDFVESWREIPESKRWASPDDLVSHEPTMYEGVDRSPKYPQKHHHRDRISVPAEWDVGLLQLS